MVYEIMLQQSHPDQDRGFLIFTAAFTVPGTEKVLSRELVNEAMKMGTCTLQREHLELLNALV